MNPAPNPLRLRLEADGRPGLYELYEAAEGAVIGGRFRLGRPFAAGRQALLYEATELASGEPVLVKQAAFDYRRPIQYSRAAAASMRHALRGEYSLLEACTTGHLPRPIALVVGPSPLPSAASSNVLGKEEVFLVEERILGHTLDQVAQTTWRALDPAAREERARAVGREYLRFWDGLERVGFHYGDLSAQNVLLEAETGRVRVVDAACAVPAGPEVVVREFTPAFLTPRLHEAMTRGLPVPGTLASVLPVLAKVLHFALTGLIPLNGEMPSWEAPELSAYSPALRKALQAMAEVDGDDRRVGPARALLLPAAE